MVNTFDALRSLATEILVVKTKATLNQLAINTVVPNMVNPLFYVISCALTLWRRMLLRDPSNRQGFFHVLANPGVDPNRLIGHMDQLQH